MWRGYFWPGLVGIGSSASGVILFVAGAEEGVDGLAAAGMILAMTGFFLGIGQVILLACVVPVGSFMVFVAARVG
jgi:hypothetical protein